MPAPAVPGGRFGWGAEPPSECPAGSRPRLPFGGADEGIPQADVDRFDAALGKAGVKHDQTVYPGAPHSFFDRKFSEFADASADAWKRVQAFVSQHTKR